MAKPTSSIEQFNRIPDFDKSDKQANDLIKKGTATIALGVVLPIPFSSFIFGKAGANKINEGKKLKEATKEKRSRFIIDGYRGNSFLYKQALAQQDQANEKFESIKNQVVQNINLASNRKPNEPLHQDLYHNITRSLEIIAGLDPAEFLDRNEKDLVQQVTSKVQQKEEPYDHSQALINIGREKVLEAAISTVKEELGANALTVEHACMINTAMCEGGFTAEELSAPADLQLVERIGRDLGMEIAKSIKANQTLNQEFFNKTVFHYARETELNEIHAGVEQALKENGINVTACNDQPYNIRHCTEHLAYENHKECDLKDLSTEGRKSLAKGIGFYTAATIKGGHYSDDKQPEVSADNSTIKDKFYDIISNVERNCFGHLFDIYKERKQKAAPASNKQEQQPPQGNSVFNALAKAFSLGRSSRGNVDITGDSAGLAV